MRLSLSALFLIGLSCAGTGQAREIIREVRISNPTRMARKAYPVVVDLHRHADGLHVRSAKVVCDGREIPSQADDLNGEPTNWPARPTSRRKVRPCTTSRCPMRTLPEATLAKHALT